MSHYAQAVAPRPDATLSVPLRHGLTAVYVTKTPTAKPAPKRRTKPAPCPGCGEQLTRCRCEILCQTCGYYRTVQDAADSLGLTLDQATRDGAEIVCQCPAVAR